MPTLRDAMREFLADWREDINEDWASLLDGVEPDFDAVDGSLTTEPDEVIFPGRKGMNLAGAPSGAHLFRALDGISPDQVRAIVVGQDPYPAVDRQTLLAKPRQATGRAFEQGDLGSWHDRVASSLISMIQCVAHFRSGDAGYLEASRNARRSPGWGLVQDRLTSGGLVLEAPRVMFDRWQNEQGVLFLNTGLTLTRFKRGGHEHQLRGHIPLWRPVIDAICVRLAEREDVPLVFLAWGSKARDFLEGAGIMESDEDDDIMDRYPNTAISARSHPSYLPWFLVEDINPLIDANQALESVGGLAIDW